LSHHHWHGGLFDDWFDPVETGLRSKLRGFIETMIEEELDTALSRARYGRPRRRITRLPLVFFINNRLIGSGW
jgi:hypothetical protein